jgi:hypothetical protein
MILAYMDQGTIRVGEEGNGESFRLEDGTVSSMPRLRRFGSRLVATSHRDNLIFLLLICVGCPAQLTPSNLAQRIERRIRTEENVPVSIKIIVSSSRTSEFRNYDTVTVAFDDDKKQNQEFLLSKDQKT